MVLLISPMWRTRIREVQGYEGDVVTVVASGPVVVIPRASGRGAPGIGLGIIHSGQRTGLRFDRGSHEHGTLYRHRQSDDGVKYGGIPRGSANRPESTHCLLLRSWTQRNRGKTDIQPIDTDPRFLSFPSPGNFLTPP